MVGCPKSKALCVGNGDGSCLFLQPKTEQEWDPIGDSLKELQRKKDEAVTMSVDVLLRGQFSNLFIAGLSNGLVRIFTTDEPRCLVELQAHSRQINALACHPSKPLFVTVSDDTFLNVWDISKQEQFEISLVSSSRCPDLQLTGVTFGANAEGALNSIVASVYDYKLMLVWDEVL